MGFRKTNDTRRSLKASVSLVCNKFNLKSLLNYKLLYFRWILEAKLQKQNSVKQGKRPKHRVKRDDSSYGNFNSKP